MRVVHLADLHLGFRQYTRLTPNGVNQREADVGRTFSTLIDRIIAIAPDLIVIAGDIFHVVRPTNNAILTAHAEFSRLAHSLPNTPIVLVAGNHDTPRSTETGGILRLFAPLGIHVVDREARRLNFPELDLSVLAVPDAGFARPALEPNPDARWNVMCLHGEVQGMLPAWMASGDRAAVEIPTERLNAPQWNYIALGHWHVYRAIAPNMYYSGSIDYTSTNIWGELAEEKKAGLSGKGFAERNLVTGEQTFHPLPRSRPIVDLPAIDAAACGAVELDSALRDAVERSEEGFDDAVVRLVVRNVNRGIARDLDQSVIRDLKRRALNFHLDLRAPDRAVRQAAAGAPLVRKMTLAEIVEEHLATKFQLAPDVDRAAFHAGALEYLARTDEERSLEPELEASISPELPLLERAS